MTSSVLSFALPPVLPRSGALIFLSRAEDPLEDVQASTDLKPFAAECVYKRFDDQTHGFCAARGDWTDAGVAAAATEAIDMLSEFCMKLVSSA